MHGVTVLIMSVSQLPVMAASNCHNSEMTSSIATKRGKGMGSVAFSDVILLKSLWMKCEAREMVGFSQKHVGTIPLTYMFGQRYQQVGNTVMNKYYMGDYVQALHWQVTVDHKLN